MTYLIFCFAVSLEKKKWITLLNLLAKILQVMSFSSKTSHTSLFNICSSCGGLYLEVLLGKPTRNVY